MGAGEGGAPGIRMAAPSAISVANLGEAALVALMVILTLQLTRVFFGLVSDLGERSGKTSDALLQFVDRCIKEAGPDATEISKNPVRTAEDLYTSWKVEDLKQEFARVDPDFGTLLEALRQEIHRYDSLDELADLLQNKAPDVVGRLGRRGSLEVLFEASVIGIRLRGAGSTRFKSEEPELTLPASGAAYVHQSLYKGLNIVEARKTGEEPTEEDQSFGEE